MSGWLESTAAAPSTSRTAASMVALPALTSQAASGWESRAHNKHRSSCHSSQQPMFAADK